ncbi:MAG TPA: nuclear transport factor 2 family protein [Gemmatimonadales bacterium]|jgi:ketosteroid isomerase-like protein|nr:nuclear transport factor 2 family protein [Gemmatimonadales bacterium]
MPTLTEMPLTEKDQTTLRQFFDDCIGFVKAGDWTSWAAMYEENGLLQPPHAPAIRGRSKLVQWGEAFPAVENLEFFDVEVHGEGNLAWGASGYTLTLRDLPPDHGKQLVVFHRAADGKWTIVAGSFNSDLPVPGSSE